jgi:hypothetical protein
MTQSKREESIGTSEGVENRRGTITEDEFGWAKNKRQWLFLNDNKDT